MMTRTEILCWTAAMAGIAWPGAAEAQYRFAGGPPIAETYALSVELSREAAALSRDAERVLCHCDGYDDVLDELRDVAEELRDLNRSLQRAYDNPRRWDRVSKRARDVEEEVCELAEEVTDALRDLHRHGPRSASFYPGGPSHHRQHFVGQAPFSFSLMVGGREVRLTKARDRGWAPAPPQAGDYRSAPPEYAPPTDGWELEQRVAHMRALAAEIVRLARVR